MAKFKEEPVEEEAGVEEVEEAISDSGFPNDPRPFTPRDEVNDTEDGF